MVCPLRSLGVIVLGVGVFIVFLSLFLLLLRFVLCLSVEEADQEEWERESSV